MPLRAPGWKRGCGSWTDSSAMAFGISKEIIEDIRSRCDIVELIGMFVQLRRAGTNTYKGLCPFHQEKTPSFHVDAARQTFHCFGCGKGGDVFRFFMEKENVGFIDALHMLASRVGVVIPENSPGEDPGAGRRRAGERERLFQVNEAFAEFFRRTLVSNPASPAALYLQKRGIPPDVAEKFRIGACPDDWTACLNYGRSIGFTDAELVNSGVVSRKAETGRCYDHFKGRLTFTIENEQGRAVGFSARALEATPAGGIYINTTETPIFKKGNLLYALPQARRMMSEKNMAIICEGQLDTIAFHRAGFECAVAPQGTSFTENQGRILRRYAGRIFLALDSDSAGQKAIRRDLEILLPMSFDIRVIRIPGGKDPDELFRNGGAEAVRRAVEGAVSWLQVLCDSLPERYDMSSPAGRGQAAAEVAEYLEKVTNPVELELYVREASIALGVSEDAFRAELGQSRRKLRMEEERRSRFSGEDGKKPEVRPAEESYPAALLTLLALAVNYEEAARQIAELLPPEELSGESPPERAINLAVNAALNGEFDQAGGAIADMLIEHPSPAVSRLLVGEHRYADVNRAVLDSIGELRRLRREEKRRELTLELRRAASPEERTAILMKLVELNRK